MGIIQPCKSQQLFRLYPEYRLEQAPEQNPYDLTILSRDRTLYVIKQSDQPAPRNEQQKRVLKVTGQQKIQEKIYTLFEWSNRSLEDLRQQRVKLNKYLNPQQMLFFLQETVAGYAELYGQEINNRNNPNKELCIKAVNIKLFKNDKVVKVLPPHIGNYKANQDPDYKPLGMNDISILALIFLDLGLLHQVRDVYAKPERLQGYLKAFEKRYGSPLTKVIKRMIQGASWQEINRTVNKGLNTSEFNSFCSGNSGNVRSINGNNNLWRLPQRQVNQTITYVADIHGQRISGKDSNSRKNLIDPQQNQFLNILNANEYDNEPAKDKVKQNTYYANSITQFQRMERERTDKQKNKNIQNFKRSGVRSESKRDSRVLVLQDPTKAKEKQISPSFVIQDQKKQQNQNIAVNQLQNRQRRVSFTYIGQQRPLQPGNIVRQVRPYSPSFNGQQNKQLTKVVSHPVFMPQQNVSHERRVGGPPPLPPQNWQGQFKLPPNVPSNAHGIHRCERSPSKILKINQDQDIVFQPSAKDTIILQPLQGVPKQIYLRKTKPDYQEQKKEESQCFVPNFIKQKQNSNPKKKPDGIKKQANPQKESLHLFSFKQKKDLKNLQELKNYYYSSRNAKQDSDSLTEQFRKQKKMSFKSKQLTDLPLVSRKLIPDPDEMHNEYRGDYHPVYRNMKHGQGIMRFSDGKVYKGSWVSNKMQGYGQLYTNAGKLIYRGFWQQNKPHGQGVIINYQPQHIPSHAKSSSLAQNFDDLILYWESYQGNFANGYWHGMGTLKLTNGDILRGVFKSGRVHGKGTYFNKYGEQIKGNWYQGVLKQKIYPYY